ncbi:MAG: rRNA maturation RNase YbeY [Planctomycetota bacterium]|nr:rRNA maturation RNase YbeY [Planctomycetota bacterium]
MNIAYGRRRPAQVIVLLAGARRMRLLNRRHLGRRGLTDVLAFAGGQAPNASHLGDIAVCVPLARRDARRRRIPVAYEICLYALHGLLHLLGWRDKRPAERRAMAEAAARCFQRLGLPTEWILQP